MSRKLAPLIAFIGTTPNIGTTTAAFATAYRLAEWSGKPIGYLCLHLKSAKLQRFIGMDDPVASLDKLHPELRSSALTVDMLRSATHAVKGQPNLRVLFGNLNREQAEFFRPEEIEHLLTVAEKTFSAVFVDLGAYWDNAATICAVRRADSRVLVTTPALSHFQEDGRRWIGRVSPLFEVHVNQYECIVVQYPWGTGGYSMKEISKELGTSPLGEFRMTDTLFAGLDKGAYNEWLKDDPTGKAAMKEPAKILMERHQLQGSFSPIVRQPWYRKLLTHRNGVSSS
ncbi:hypothetical protein I6N90_20295 [Paenibacillus sp. GSMTC-2017]|uniref:hypothetical protein n=1 Tax=Paenibacillus sp. GSMTC-2017 TaxID=2794350 RepID=UPI0018D9531B|nr:hypothetical protein [Paenibacillus sp. GSMTC-2017]MBH5320149.1 hypothetical protein [Paenibacillus sp. GSMTC-2017]